MVLMKTVLCIQTIDLSHRDAKVLAPLTTDSSQGESTVKDAMYMKRFQEAMQFFIKKAF
jgi:hypothetical protein